jgi:hypothetical protein
MNFIVLVLLIPAFVLLGIFVATMNRLWQRWEMKREEWRREAEERCRDREREEAREALRAFARFAVMRDEPSPLRESNPLDGDVTGK